MTVVAAYIDGDGEAMVFSDSCGSSSDGATARRHDAIKTIRFNDSWALALAGNNYGAGLIGSALYGNDIICQDTFARIEELGLVRNDLDGEGAVSFFGRYFAQSGAWIPAITADCHVLLTGSDGVGQRLYRWPSEQDGWEKPQEYEIKDSGNILVLVAPDRISWLDVGIPAEDAVGVLLKHYAKRFPSMVDRNLRIRRRSHKFELDPVIVGED